MNAVVGMCGEKTKENRIVKEGMWWRLVHGNGTVTLVGMTRFCIFMCPSPPSKKFPSSAHIQGRISTISISISNINPPLISILFYYLLINSFPILYYIILYTSQYYSTVEWNSHISHQNIYILQYKFCLQNLHQFSKLKVCQIGPTFWWANILDTKYLIFPVGLPFPFPLCWHGWFYWNLCPTIR